MTAQIGDKYTYENKTFTVVEMSSARLFNPRNFGMEPHSNSSACWRGYWCEYAITDDELLLKNFHMFNRNDDYPPLNGVEVSPPEYLEFEGPRSNKNGAEKIRILDHCGHRIYRDVNMRIPYTGKILLGADFMREYYVHMGIQSSWAYRQLTELVFVEGLLLESNDLSYIAKAQREAIQDGIRGRRRRDLSMLDYFQIIEDRFASDDRVWWVKKR